MYIYNFELTFAKKKTNLNFEKCKIFIKEAIDSINDGITFRRDCKQFYIIKITASKLTLKLSSKIALQNPSRSISALTRYLTTYHTEIFENSMYNKTLFSIKLISQETELSDSHDKLTNEELLKGLIDLLYGYTAISNSDTITRDQTIQELKKLIYPYIKSDSH